MVKHKMRFFRIKQQDSCSKQDNLSYINKDIKLNVALMFLNYKGMATVEAVLLKQKYEERILATVAI